MEKKYDAKRCEGKIAEFWKNEEVYRFNINNPGEIYSIDTPPPTVSGTLHIGHVFSYTQAEIIARFKRMNGYNVFYPFGFDDNGLPTERLVEKELNIKASDLKRSDFNKLCLDVIKEFENQYVKLWNDLGFSCDWDLAYRTISPLSQKISQKSFIDLYNKGHVILKDSPVLYCTNCQTSIAQSELEVKEIASKLNYIKFTIENKDVHVATTRPELLYSCKALLINPNDSRCRLYAGKFAKVPIYNFEVPVLLDEDVEIKKGTGIVMSCTFGDIKDLEWFKKYDFDYTLTIAGDGKIDSDVPHIGGLYLNKARAKIVEILRAKELLIESIDINHNVSVHERCGTPIEIIQSKQWFINVLDSKERLLKAADEVNWYPENMKAKYIIWVENLKWDWCISRQRYFGVPFPVWHCKECHEIIVADENELPVYPMEKIPSKKCKCGSSNYEPETAILDTWATSSVTPLINAKWGEDNSLMESIFPMSMRTQAHEIIRTWAFYTIAKSILHFNQVPWNDIMICGFVLARKGEKISKSKKNEKMTPSALIEQYSADSLRYWSASSKLGTDTTFSEKELKISSRFITKLWNASRFCFMHLENYQVDENDLILAQDKWILEKLKFTQLSAKKYLENYEVGLARHVLDEFFWKDFCDNYLELCKDRLYKVNVYGVMQRKSSQYSIFKVMFGVIQMYSIFTPYVTEELYLNFYKKYFKEVSIHLTKWSNDYIIKNELIEFGEQIKTALMEVRKYKSKKALSLKDELEKVIISVPRNQESNFGCVHKDFKAAMHCRNVDLQVSDKIKIEIE